MLPAIFLHCFPLARWRIIWDAGFGFRPHRPGESAQFHHADPHLQHPAADLDSFHQPLSSSGRPKGTAGFGAVHRRLITDGIDGYLARKRGQITTMGMLLDPLADKLLIAAAFVTLVQFNPSLVPAWMAVVIIGREFLVSGLRSIAASEGFTIEASDLGKFKMLVQIISVVAVILDHRWKEWPVYGPYFFPVHWIALLAIWFMVFCRWCRPAITSSPSGRRSTARW